MDVVSEPYTKLSTLQWRGGGSQINLTFPGENDGEKFLIYKWRRIYKMPTYTNKS